MIFMNLVVHPIRHTEYHPGSNETNNFYNVHQFITAHGKNLKTK